MIDYKSYKYKHPERILVYVESFDKANGTILFDFVNSIDFSQFKTNLSFKTPENFPSMVLVENYYKRPLKENTIYFFKLDSLKRVELQTNLVQNVTSLTIGFILNFEGVDGDFFNSSVSLYEYSNESYNDNIYPKEDNALSGLFETKGQISVRVRKIGQGNWNEIIWDDKIKMVYDVGASLYASSEEINNYIESRNKLYPLSKPILIISHWDIDHYHSLIGMTDAQITANFSAFICRDLCPNLTSKTLFDRIEISIGSDNTYLILPDKRKPKKHPVKFRPYTSINKQIVLFNSEFHKNRNLSGLSLLIKTANSSIVLAADANYDQISAYILPHLNYKHTHNLVVPHHGGKAGKYIYNTPNGVLKGLAVISVGFNHYKHPIAAYVDALRSNFPILQQTNMAEEDILINL
ncbi:hypothetical protein [Sphingobacterium siyangense]|uniref:hypothetical protein n=1 Tax=Sphingobacterium siyangense TaxID=459529 RepID=UPI003DA456E7